MLLSKKHYSNNENIDSIEYDSNGTANYKAVDSISQLDNSDLTKK